MIRTLASFLRYFLFWYLVFVAGRVLFLFFNSELAFRYALTDLLQTFYHGILLDISMTSYLCVIPLLFWYGGSLLGIKPKLVPVLKVYQWTLLALVFILFLIDAELYRFWGQKLNAYASSFAKFPKEMLVFSSSASVVKPLLALVVGFFLFRLMMRRLMKVNTETKDGINKWSTTVMFFLFVALLVAGIRGGFGKSTANQSAAFFSDKPFLNHTAINTVWNFMASVIEPLETTSRNPYTFTDASEADQLLENLLAKEPQSKHISLTDATQPNILFILLEGWSADVVEACGGEKDVTPQLNQIINESYVFTRFYANGNRTDKGLAAVLSAQPALANSSIINHIEKYTNMPSLPREFANRGYYTSFYYGGDSKFANMKGYLLTAGIKGVFDLDDYPLSQRNAEWGVHDDRLYARMIEGLSKQTQPFFSVALTLSSHEPFRIPVDKRFNSNNDADDYRSSVYFSDSCLGYFYKQIQTQPWYKNTLVVIVSDHAHRWPKDRNVWESARYHIPMIIGGGALKQEWRGKQQKRIAAQVDIASTLLHQFGFADSAFKWSRTMLDTTSQGFASYVLNDAIGTVSDSAELVFDQESKRLIYFNGSLPPQRLEFYQKRARAYEQVYYDEFIKR